MRKRPIPHAVRKRNRRNGYNGRSRAAWRHRAARALRRAVASVADAVRVWKQLNVSAAAATEAVAPFPPWGRFPERDAADAPPRPIELHRITVEVDPANDFDPEAMLREKGITVNRVMLPPEPEAPSDPHSV